MTMSVMAFVDVVRLLHTGIASSVHPIESPELPERLGIELAERLSPMEPTTIVVWEGTATAVLGHVVARELQANLVYAFAEEGIIGLSAEIQPNSRVAAISYDWTEYPGLDSMIAFLGSAGASIVGIGSVLDVPAPTTSAPVVSLEADMP